MRRRPATAWWGVLLMTLVTSTIGLREASAQLGALVSPGRLSRAHASLEGISNCLQCHSAGRGIAAEKCLTCHKPVADRIAQRKGIHRNAANGCVACHVEHAGVDAELRPFNTERFDHRGQTGLALDGLHSPIAANCATCHKTRSFLTATPSCSSCHTDAHKGSLGSNCATCHTASIKFAESRTRFDHSRTAFPLAGAHTKVGCASCHATKTSYKIAGFASCETCHTDPHRERFGNSCSSCHTPQAWKTTRIDHSRTSFPLRGAHASVQCVSCHVKPATEVKPRSDTCAACHTDPHRGVFKQDCASCHTDTTFKKAVSGNSSSGFDHSSTRFPLVDAHATLACSTCHTGQNAPVTTGTGRAAAPAPSAPGTPPRRTIARPATGGTPRQVADFGGLKTECVSCHADVHRAELGTSCETCHTARTFQVSAFRHAMQRPFFSGQHATLRCAQCHTSVYDTTAAATRVAAAASTRPVRSTTPAPIVRVGFTKASGTCVSCHSDVHLGQVGARCETCHTVETAKFAVTNFQHTKTKFPLTGKHAPLKCDACHAVATQAFPAGHGTARRLTGIGTECASCHKDPHASELGTDCQSCHSTDTFAIKRYTHRRAPILRSFFTGKHITVCSACHKPAAGRTAAPTAVLASYKASTACISCHLDVHRGALGPRCESCHKP
jgi:cytochrome c7-like protein